VWPPTCTFVLTYALTPIVFSAMDVSSYNPPHTKIDTFH
jgi:hypothetical protein